MRARAARLLRSLAARIDGPQVITLNFTAAESPEMATLREEWVRKYGAPRPDAARPRRA
jgi:hypothetical protein